RKITALASWPQALRVWFHGTVGVERRQIPFVAQVRRNLIQKTGWTLNPAAALALRGTHQRIAQVELVFRPGDGHVKKAPLLFHGLEVFLRTRRRKRSLAEHDDENDRELETLYLVYGRQPQLLAVRRHRPVLFRLQIGVQRQLAQEFVGPGKLAGEGGQLLEVFQPRAIVRVMALQI